MKPQVASKTIKDAVPDGWADSDGIFKRFRDAPALKAVTDPGIHARIAVFQMLNDFASLRFGGPESSHPGKPVDFSTLCDDDIGLIAEIGNSLHAAGKLEWNARKDWLSARDVAITSLFFDGISAHAEQIRARLFPLDPTAKPVSLTDDGVDAADDRRNPPLLQGADQKT